MVRRGEVLALLIAAWAILTGLLEVGAAVVMRRIVGNTWILLAGGILSIVFGVLMALFPAAGLLAVVWLIGAYAILFGALFIGLAFKLRGSRRRVLAT